LDLAACRKSRIQQVTSKHNPDFKDDNARATNVQSCKNGSFYLFRPVVSGLKAG
jgi:hypothetical protein